MKKILIFSIAYYPLVGGAEVAIKEITDRIDDFQYDLVTAHLDKNTPKEEKIGNVNIYRIKGPKFLFPILGYQKAKKLHRKNNYDLIWSIMAAYAGFTALFFKLKNPKIPFLLTLQEGDSEEHILKRVGIFYPLWRKIFKKADYIQAISNYLADFAKKYGAKCPIEVVPNGVDLEKFLNIKISEENETSVLRCSTDLCSTCILDCNSGVEEKEKILITTSRLVKKNAIDDVIKSVQYLPDNVKFMIVGKGEELKKLRKLSLNLKIEGRVWFLGHLGHNEILNYLARADVFVRPSLSEGLGNSFLEAMAAGVPVIATPVGGIPDFLKDGETGLFCEVHNPKSIAEKVKVYLENDELREKIIKNAKEMVIKNYDWNLIADKMKAIMQKLFNANYANTY